MEFKNLSGGGKSGFAYSAFIILNLLFSLLVQALGGIFFVKDDAYYRLICSLAMPVSVTIIAFIFSASEKRKITSVAGLTKFNPLYLIPAVLLAGGMLFGFGFVNIAFSDLLKNAGLTLNSPEIPLDDGLQLTLMIFALAVMPAVFEEVLFRGVMRGYLNGVKTVIAIALVALSFALFHGSITQFIYQFIYGCFLTWLAIKADSAIPSMIAHFANNFVILMLEYFSVNINFYNGFVIAGGLVALLGVTAFLLFFKRDKSQKPDNKKNIIGFSIFASVGWLVMLITIICALFV